MCRSHRMYIAGFCLHFFAFVAFSQEPIRVGKGSYASFPPPGAAEGKAIMTEDRPLNLDEKTDRPIPSNKWFQNLLFQKYAVGLWAMPHRVDTSSDGITVHYPALWRKDGTQMDTTHHLLIGAENFIANRARAKTWSDWLVSFRLDESSDSWMDVTLGEGMPYVWTESQGIDPKLTFLSPGKAPAPRWKAFDQKGGEIKFPITADHIGLECLNQHYGVFVPPGTRFESDGRSVTVFFSGKARYLIVCPMPAANDLAYFHKHAGAIPRDTKYSWTYDPVAGQIKTTWKIKTEALRASDTKVLQGWLAHHWRESKNDLAFDGREYATARGKMRCAPGDEFHIDYKFDGIVPTLPTPSKGGYEPAIMREHLKYFPKHAYARDSYAAGKEMVRQANAAHIARSIGDPSSAAITESLRNELTNWLTYTPGERERYFAFYPKRKGLVGMNASFGSEHFTDHHFHYGYFTVAAGMLSQIDENFSADYGEMARLIAKEYANWDRTDNRFPFLRTFDIWRGHSFADGNGFPDGNNQESTGEAIQSWVGLILLGEALGDKEMISTGVMGYTIETRATMEYWFNIYGDVFPKEWKHPIAGMIWSGRMVWGTWFTASPAWIYGIQWLPSAPWAAYLARDPKFAKQAYETMAEKYETWEAANAAKKRLAQAPKATTESFGPELGSYMLGYRMLYDPKAVTEEFTRLRKTPGDKLADNPWMANVYFQSHSLTRLGRPDPKFHADSPTAVAYANDQGDSRTYVVWNPSDKERIVNFYRDGQRLGRVVVPPKSLGEFAKLTGD